MAGRSTPHLYVAGGLALVLGVSGCFYGLQVLAHGFMIVGVAVVIGIIVVVTNDLFGAAVACLVLLLVTAIAVVIWSFYR